MNFQLARLGHLGLQVADVDRSIEFYRKVLGFKLTGKWGQPDFFRPICFMRLGEKHHDLVFFELAKDLERAGLTTTDSSEREDVGVHHIAFEVDTREDWLLCLDHVRDCGVEIVEGPLVHGHEATGRQSFRGGSGSHCFFFLDPDGNRIEILYGMMTVTRPTVAAPGD